VSKEKKIRIALVAGAWLILILLATLALGCAFTSPFKSAPTLAPPSAPTPTTITPALPSVSSVNETLWQFGWLSVLLLLFFPAIREPLVQLWTSIFRTLAIPFLAVRHWYDNKISSNS